MGSVSGNEKGRRPISKQRQNASYRGLSVYVQGSVSFSEPFSRLIVQIWRRVISCRVIFTSNECNYPHYCSQWVETRRIHDCVAPPVAAVVFYMDYIGFASIFHSSIKCSRTGQSFFFKILTTRATTQSSRHVRKSWGIRGKYVKPIL